MSTALLGMYYLQEKYSCRSVHFVKLCLNFLIMVNCGRISSVCRVFNCRVGGCGFDSGTGPILRVLKLLINVHVLYLLCKWLDLHLIQMTTKMLVSSPWGDTNYSVLNKYFCAKYIETQINCFFFICVRSFYYYYFYLLRFYIATVNLSLCIQPWRYGLYYQISYL